MHDIIHESTRRGRLECLANQTCLDEFRDMIGYPPRLFRKTPQTANSNIVTRWTGIATPLCKQPILFSTFDATKLDVGFAVPNPQRVLRLTDLSIYVHQNFVRAAGRPDLRLAALRHWMHS